MDDHHVIATFHPQYWENDYALPAGPSLSFDVTAEVLAMGKERALKLQDDQYCSDDLRFSANAPHAVKHWTGPFYIEVAASVADYFDQEAS